MTPCPNGGHRPTELPDNPVHRRDITVNTTTMNTENLVAALEAVALGEPWAEQLAAATAAVAAERVAATGELFPAELAPTPGDAVTMYGHIIGRLPIAAYGDHLAAQHGRAVRQWPALAALMRSPNALEDVAAAAAGWATPAAHNESIQTAATRAAAEARARYIRTVAHQVADCPGHELAAAARAILASEDLDRHLAAVKARHEEHAKANLTRIEAERRAAAALAVDETVERIRAAEAVAADAHQRAAQSANEYRRARADAFVARLKAAQAAGLKDLRVGGDLYGIDNLIDAAHGQSVERITRYEAALAAAMGSR